MECFPERPDLQRCAQAASRCAQMTIKFMLVVRRWEMWKRDSNGRGKGNLKLVPTQFVAKALKRSNENQSLRT